MRICSLLPSATEILYALGLGDSLVGVTHECDFPPDALTKPRVIRPRVHPLASPAELDREVREFISRGESLYSVDESLIASLNPDLIFTQDLCQVCAAAPDDLGGALARFPRRPEVLSLRPQNLLEVWRDIRRIGEATDRIAQADRLVAAIERRLGEIEGAIRATKRPRVLCLEWVEPFYCAGHWVPEMVERARGSDVFGRRGEPSIRIEGEKILEAGPEVIMVMPCGYTLERATAEFRAANLPPGWERLPAVRDNRVFAVDANSYFSRSGPRLVEGVALLAHLLHPECDVPRVPACAFQILGKD